MCNETEKHRRWKRYRYFIASLIFSTTTAPANRLSISSLGNQCSQLPTCPMNWCQVSVPKPTWGQAWGSTGCVWGEMEGTRWPGMGSRTDVHSWRVKGWVALGWTLSHVLSLLLDPALCQPPRGSIPELGGGRAGCGLECWTQPHAVPVCN